jgi:hypothetical protein
MKTLAILTTLSVLPLFAVSSAQVTVQAEAYAATGGTVTNPTGQTPTLWYVKNAAGYIGYGDNADWARYSVAITTSGQYNIALTYANGGTTAYTISLADSMYPASAAPVGARNIATVSCAGTGGWTTWKTQTIFGAPLKAGAHTIILTTTGATNIDKMVFTLLKATTATANVQTLDCGLSASGGTYIPVWGDDFAGTVNGALPDATKWNWLEGSYGWGNKELQYNSAKRATNSYLDGAGHLVIKAVKEAFNDKTWTSARLSSKGIAAFIGGKIEFSVKTEAKAGSWNLAGIMGDSYLDETDWPYCGEVRVFDNYRNDAVNANNVPTSFHTRDHYGYSATRNTTNTTIANLTTAFKIFTLYWTSDRLELVTDGTYRGYFDKASYTANWPFDKAMNLFMTVGVGGTRGGSVGTNTSIMNTYDYVKVYKLDNSAPPPEAPVEKIINGKFDTALDSWTQYVNAPATGNFAVVGGGCKATITTGSSTAYSVQLYQPVAFVAGQHYSLRFDAYSSISRTIDVVCEQNGTPYGAIVGSAKQTVPVTAKMKTFVYGFNCTTAQPLGRLCFNLANATNNQSIVLDNISLLQGTESIPSDPINLEAIPKSSTQIDLTWGDNSLVETGYYVYRNTTNTQPTNPTYTLAANATSYSNTGLTLNTTYYYWVCAYNTSGSSTDISKSATTDANTNWVEDFRDDFSSGGLNTSYWYQNIEAWSTMKNSAM